ncbi:acetyltransferase-like isoleucine patch superfamily enzyme [Salinibacter ruber]|uniref:acyltransferase n=1 Tax=Salinibacter ruber TaxID=146919 RepID=UPI000E58E66C|nr:acyltransferase [Salinibacter ruber]MCS3705882.1 acetyltransferase-like isoleucine patch superfamily enzyme [Salinibacter ruber]
MMPDISSVKVLYEKFTKMTKKFILILRQAYSPVVQFDRWKKFSYLMFVPLYLLGRLLKNIYSMGKYSLAYQRLGHAGRNIKLDKNITICGHERIMIGNDVFIGEGSIIDAGRGGSITIDSGCEIAAHVRVISWNHEMAYGEPLRHQEDTCKDVEIGCNVWIGFGVTIIPGVSVGSYSIIAAGAVVVDDVPEGSIVGGVPASVVATVNGYE